jgi:hypothetical protein
VCQRIVAPSWLPWEHYGAYPNDPLAGGMSISTLGILVEKDASLARTIGPYF